MGEEKEKKVKAKAHGLRSMGLLFCIIRVKRQPLPAQWAGLMALIQKQWVNLRGIKARPSLNEFSKGLEQEIDFRITANSDSYAFVARVLHQPYKDVGFLKL